MDHKVVGGVCSGLAAYFNIDVIIIRVLYLALFFLPSIIHIAANFRHWSAFFNFPWFFVLVYVLLWIVIPAATVEEKYAMRGEPVSAKGIQQPQTVSGTTLPSMNPGLRGKQDPGPWDGW